MYKQIFFILILIKIIIINKEKNYISKIPKVLFQTSKEEIPDYVKNKNKKHIPKWKYLFFTDKDIIEFFNSNPIKKFPNIIDKFNSLTNGAHKADLFRYYYLYIKGGVFIDSDAILEENIETIIKDYDFVSVKSIVPNTLFNGFIATNKKNIIIYNALKLLYNTNNEELTEKYHLICEQFFNVYSKYKNNKSKLLFEYHNTKFNNICVKTYDENNTNVLTHFSWCKKIPKDSHYSYNFDYGN